MPEEAIEYATKPSTLQQRATLVRVKPLLLMPREPADEARHRARLAGLARDAERCAGQRLTQLEKWVELWQI